MRAPQSSKVKKKLILYICFLEQPVQRQTENKGDVIPLKWHNQALDVENNLSTDPGMTREQAIFGKKAQKVTSLPLHTQLQMISS